MISLAQLIPGATSKASSKVEKANLNKLVFSIRRSIIKNSINLFRTQLPPPLFSLTASIWLSIWADNYK